MTDCYLYFMRMVPSHENQYFGRYLDFIIFWRDFHRKLQWFTFPSSFCPKPSMSIRNCSWPFCPKQFMKCRWASWTVLGGKVMNNFGRSWIFGRKWKNHCNFRWIFRQKMLKSINLSKNSIGIQDSGLR